MPFGPGEPLPVSGDFEVTRSLNAPDALSDVFGTFFPCGDPVADSAYRVTGEAQGIRSSMEA